FRLMLWPRTDAKDSAKKMLVTHRGLSGPAILQISSYWEPGTKLSIDLAPDRDVTEPLRNNSRRDIASMRTALRAALPQRLADRWLELHAPKAWTNHALAELERVAHNWALAPAGIEGYDKAEVTAGG